MCDIRGESLGQADAATVTRLVAANRHAIEGDVLVGHLDRAAVAGGGIAAGERQAGEVDADVATAIDIEESDAFAGRRSDREHVCPRAGDGHRTGDCDFGVQRDRCGSTEHPSIEADRIRAGF